jgi:putative PIN family toxin of toxin-antitoxin system
MKIFLDTNVLVSAFATRGLCADVLREVFASHVLLTCVKVLEEMKWVFMEKFGVSEALIKELVLLLHNETIVDHPTKTVDVPLKYKTDIQIVSAALAGRADVLVTGDRKLQNLIRIGNLKILSPREFWEMLRTQ